MKHPGFIAWLIGNSVVFMTLALAMFWSIYCFFVGDGFAWAALPLMVASHASYRANERLRAYKSWKQDWQAMNGTPARRPLSLGLSRKWLRYGVGGVVLALAVAFSPELLADPDTAWMVGLFWMGVAGMAAFGLFRAAAQKRGKAASGASPIVSVCLNVPRQSPAVSQTYAALPDYCQRLMGQ